MIDYYRLGCRLEFEAMLPGKLFLLAVELQSQIKSINNGELILDPKSKARFLVRADELLKEVERRQK